MGWVANVFVLGVILFIAGTGIPIMAALNAGLGTHFGNPIPAAFVLFSIALAATAVLTFGHPLPSKDQMIAIPIHYYLGWPICCVLCSVNYLDRAEDRPRKCDLSGADGSIDCSYSHRSSWAIECT